MLKKIVAVIAALLIAIVVYAALQPNVYTFSREITINAPASAIFPHVASPKKMDAWNPWLKPDPQVKLSYSGPESGVGAASSWDGNSEVGAGTVTVVEVAQNTLVRAKLQHLKPMQGSSLVEFTLRPMGTQTIVRWGITSERPFGTRIICSVMALLMNMDKMMTTNFDKGLADLKTLVEASPR